MFYRNLSNFVYKIVILVRQYFFLFKTKEKPFPSRHELLFSDVSWTNKYFMNFYLYKLCLTQEKGNPNYNKGFLNTCFSVVTFSVYILHVFIHFVEYLEILEGVFTTDVQPYRLMVGVNKLCWKICYLNTLSAKKTVICPRCDSSGGTVVENL